MKKYTSAFKSIRLVPILSLMYAFLTIFGASAFGDSPLGTPSSEELTQYISGHVSTTHELGLQDNKISNPLAPLWTTNLSVAVLSDTSTNLSAPISLAIFLIDYYSQAAGLSVEMGDAHSNVFILDAPDPFNLASSEKFSEVYSSIYGGLEKLKTHFSSIRMDACYFENILNSDGTIRYGLIFIDSTTPEGRSSKCVSDLMPHLFGVQNIVINEIGQRFSNPKFMLTNYLMIGALSKLYQQNHEVGDLTADRIQSTIREMLERN